MREYGSNINLPSLDNLFSSEQERQDAKLEKIQILPLTELHPFRNHPFQVRDDDEMDKMVDSVKEYGVMTPAIVRPRKDGGYEIVAGHRRCHASQRAGVETMPCIVRDMDDDTAIILMVDSNCQREHMACYYHYCALLRKAYHGKTTKRCYFLLREDFLLFSRYQQQTKFLWENHIETMDELLAYKENAEVQIQQLARQRKVLYRQKREPERAAREEKIKSLTQQMKALRHEVYICSDIETDAAEVQEKLRQAELAAQEERNEVKQDEQRRRSSRSDGAGSLTGYRGGH